MVIKKPTKKLPKKVNSKKPKSVKWIDPDQRLITKRQAAHLAKLSSISAKNLVAKKITEVHDLLRWKIDPSLLLFRRICGRVVKRDPETGELHPVPNATVHVEDTDCSFLGFFPQVSPWVWFFPFICKREEIATVNTDACGHFCVYIPRWDVDRILRFRLERICLPEIFKPTIREIIEWLEPPTEPPIIKPPRPEPDPVPDWLKNFGAMERIKELLGPEIEDQLDAYSVRRTFGESTRSLNTMLDNPALTKKIAPPLPSRLRRIDVKKRIAELAVEFGVKEESFQSIDFSHYIGPFWRCRYVIIPEWITVLDVPDITFRVTQDVDDDGNEETIYSEGFFDVRWNMDPIPDVTLEANEIALSTPTCEGPEIDPGTCTGPELRSVGLMTLESTYHDATKGYGLRPNRPKPGGFEDSSSSGTGEAPYWGTLQLHGCHRIGNAKYYRLTYVRGEASEIPFTGLKWYAPRLGPGAPIHKVPDPDGWYQILTPSDLVFPNWLLNWNTRSFANGLYKVRVELGNAAKNPLDKSPEVGFMIDNTKPHTEFTEIRWRVKGISDPGNLLPDACPVIRRPTGTDIELIVKYYTSADHFRDVKVEGYGCGAGDLIQALPDEKYRYEHWHEQPDDNSWGQTAIFDIPGLKPEGVYTVRIFSVSRAFNPAGFNDGPATDWFYNPSHLWRHPARHIALIDE